MRHLAGRPVAARLLEPLTWAAAFGLAVPRIGDAAAAEVLAVGALFLLARLASDTAPNLVVCERLEAAPFDERPIRRALASAKLTLALGAALACFVACGHLPRLAAVWAKAIADLGGGAVFTIGLLATLASFTIASPVVRGHRGIPIARPNLGPAAGALLFLAGAPLSATTAAEISIHAAVAIVLGNLVVGSIQRYRAAAARLASPAVQGGTPQDLRAGSSFRPEEERYLALGALRILPFLLLPAWPPLASALAGTIENPRAALAAALVAAMPPILFDAKRGSRRFGAAAVAGAAVLFAFGLAGTGDPLLVRTAVVMLAFPPASRLIARGQPRILVRAFILLVLATAAQAILLPRSSLPLAELLAAGLIAAAALRCDARGGRVR